MSPRVSRGIAIGAAVVVVVTAIGAAFGAAMQVNHPHSPEALVGLLIGVGCGLFLGLLATCAYLDVTP